MNSARKPISTDLVCSAKMATLLMPREEARKLLDENTAAIENIANSTTMIQITRSPLSFQNSFMAYSLRTASLNWRPRSS